MAYTIQRLQQVKRLFLGVKSTHYENFDDWIRTKYSLRKRTTQTQTLCSTWIDNDDTDDYDPRADKRALKRKCPARVDDSGSSRPAKKARPPSRLIVTMCIKSDAGKAFLSSLPFYHDGPHHDGGGLMEIDAVGSASGSRYAFRKRDKTNDADIDVDLGHPAARGCKSCWELNQECSLLDSPLDYPCEFCSDDEIDCVLIISPVWKRTCENCKRIKKGCSYNHEKSDHSLPCRICQQQGIRCIAGPAKYIPKASEPAQDSQVGSHSGTEEVPIQAVQPQPADNPNETGSASSLASEPSEPKESEKTGSIGITRMIQTSYAHPMDFAYEPPEDGTDPCNWCNNFIYGLVGLGRKTVEVMDFGDGNYYEVDGGHVSQGHKPSRMCVTCALERIHIMRCSSHRVIPLQGYDIESFNFDAAFESLVPGPGQDTPAMINPWCSLCPNPAFYGCATTQSVNKFQEAVDASSSEATGCGLLLCERCELLMRAYNGNLARVVARTKQEDEEFGCRADVGFLLPGNEMYRFYTDT